MDRLEPTIYKMVKSMVKAYPELTTNGDARFLTKAIEETMKTLDKTEQKVIKDNLFFGIPYQNINAPMSESSMKRLKRRFTLEVYKRIR